MISLSLFDIDRGENVDCGPLDHGAMLSYTVVTVVKLMFYPKIYILFSFSSGGKQ
jgi:hypothetical protein